MKEKNVFNETKVGVLWSSQISTKEKKNICSNWNLAKDLSQRGYYPLEHWECIIFFHIYKTMGIGREMFWKKDTRGILLHCPEDSDRF